MRASKLVVSAVGFLLAVSLGWPVLAEEPAKDEGQDLYTKKCAMCHSANGVGKPMAKGSGNFNDPAWQKATTDEAIGGAIRDGKNKMPKFADKLTAEQIQAIVRHIRQLK